MWSDLTLIDELKLGRRIVRRDDTVVSRVRVWTPADDFVVGCPAFDDPARLVRAVARFHDYLACQRATAITLLRQSPDAATVVAMGFKHDGDIIRYDGYGFAFWRAASTTIVGATFHVPMWSIEDELLGMMPFRQGAEERAQAFMKH